MKIQIFKFQMEDELDMETQLERELAAEQEELLEVEEDEDDVGMNGRIIGDDYEEDEDKERESMVENEKIPSTRPGLAKVRSLPANFIYNPPRNVDGTNIIYIMLHICKLDYANLMQRSCCHNSL